MAQVTVPAINVALTLQVLSKCFTFKVVASILTKDEDECIGKAFGLH